MKVLCRCEKSVFFEIVISLSLLPLAVKWISGWKNVGVKFAAGFDVCSSRSRDERERKRKRKDSFDSLYQLIFFSFGTSQYPKQPTKQPTIAADFVTTSTYYVLLCNFNYEL